MLWEVLSMLQGEQTWNSHVNEIDDHLPNLHDPGRIQRMVYIHLFVDTFFFWIIQYDFDI